MISTIFVNPLEPLKSDLQDTVNLNVFVIIGLCIVFLWAIQVLLAISNATFTWKSLINLLASACIVIGGVGFIGMALSATAGLWRSHSFEWPIGRVSGALVFADGTVVVPHTPSSRIQIYDQSFLFIKGWGVDAGGGTFSLIPADENSFYVFTARGKKKYRYALDGTLTDSANYQHSYPEFDPSTFVVDIPTPLYKRIFAKPVISGLIAGIGFGLFIITGVLRIGRH